MRHKCQNCAFCLVGYVKNIQVYGVVVFTGEVFLITMDHNETNDVMMLMLFLSCIGVWRYYRRNLRSPRRPRRYAVRPMNRSRRRFGHFYNLVRFMKTHDIEQFFKYTRMTPELYDHLLELIAPRLTRTASKRALSADHKLTMTLHYLAEGCSMQQIAWDFYVGKTTVHKVIKETCRVLWEVLMPLYLPPLTIQNLTDVEEGFYKRWNVPNCIGALDGKHVVIQAPPNSGTNYFSYKKTFSLVLMATCDSFYRFLYVDVGGLGSQHDSKTFRESAFGSQLLNNQLPIPRPKPLPGTIEDFPCFVVADQAFPLHRHIMRPYPGEQLPRKKRIFNYRLSRARRCIENTFGILVQRWRCLRKPIIGNVDTCTEIVQGTLVLHNFLQKKEEDLPLRARRYCPTGYADYVDDNGVFHYGEWRNNGERGLQSVGRMGSNNPGQATRLLRDKLADYFYGPNGEVTWQYDLLDEGRLPPAFVNDTIL